MQPDWKQVDLEKVHWLEETRLEAKKNLLPEPKKMEATQGERLHAFLSHLVGLKGWFHLHSRYIVQILVQSYFELPSQIASSSRSNWTRISISYLNGSWNDKH